MRDMDTARDLAMDKQVSWNHPDYAHMFTPFRYIMINCGR
jgi:hypothetical protein